jgi:hypothetical protein
MVCLVEILTDPVDGLWGGDEFEIETGHVHVFRQQFVVSALSASRRASGEPWRAAGALCCG